jgi:hypothetical protein
VDEPNETKIKQVNMKDVSSEWLNDDVINETKINETDDEIKEMEMDNNDINKVLFDT